LRRSNLAIWHFGASFVVDPASLAFNVNGRQRQAWRELEPGSKIFEACQP